MTAPNTDGVVAPSPRLVTEIVVIGAGQAGLSAAYHLKRRRLEPGRGFLVLDGNTEPGGAWSDRWPSLTPSAP